MTAIALFIGALVALLLTAWLVALPVEVVAGAVKALRHGGWRREKRR